MTVHYKKPDITDFGDCWNGCLGEYEAMREMVLAR
jgi:hypothetical protein